MLEITYDTGFTVILQGPAKYEITSNHGGFLSTGRLTGRANAERARGFVVDMPGASVTDLGTEFGAEVRPDGTVETVVFSGSVRLVPTTPQGNVGIGQILREGQAAQVCLAAGSAGSGNANSEGLPLWALSKAEVVPASNSERFARSMPAIPSQVLLDATQFNGSFESPAIGPDNCDDEASDPTNKVYTKTRNAVPQAWNRTFALRTKGTSVQGVTGEQYVVLQGATSTLSTQFNGKPGHPPARKYEPHTVYVLTADVGGDVRGLKARVALNAGNDPICQAVAVSVSERDALEPIPTLALNTDAHPEFIGKPISISFVKTEASPVSQLYIDNVVLRAFPSKP